MGVAVNIMMQDVFVLVVYCRVGALTRQPASSHTQWPIVIGNHYISQQRQALNSTLIVSRYKVHKSIFGAETHGF